METRANFILVGAFVLTLFLGSIGFVLWLTRFEAEASYEKYRIYFTGSVSGLQVGSRVAYRGVTVGEVTEIRIDSQNVDRIVVGIRIVEETPIKADTKASLELQGITGGVLVMLTGGTNESPPLDSVSPTRPSVIESQPSQIERLLSGAPALVDSIDVLVRQASDLLSAENRAAFAATLENVRQFSAALAGRSDSMGGLVDNAAATMKNLNAMSQSLTSLTRKLETDIPRTLNALDQTDSEARKLIVDLQQTATSATRAVTEFGGIAADNRAAIRDFSNTGLYEASYLLAELRTLVTSLNRVTTEVGRDPARFIFGGGSQHGFEAKQ